MRLLRRTTLKPSCALVHSDFGTLVRDQPFWFLRLSLAGAGQEPFRLHGRLARDLPDGGFRLAVLAKRQPGFPAVVFCLVGIPDRDRFSGRHPCVLAFVLQLDKLWRLFCGVASSFTAGCELDRPCSGVCWWSFRRLCLCSRERRKVDPA